MYMFRRELTMAEPSHIHRLNMRSQAEADTIMFPVPTPGIRVPRRVLAGTPGHINGFNCATGAKTNVK